jgi:KipI family sensor histidine kinase inhibitor
LNDHRPRYLPLGDSAITVALGEGISRELSGEVAQLTRTLADSNIEGILDVVPSYAALAVHYDPRIAGYDEMISSLRRAVAAARASGSTDDSDTQRAQCVRIPVRYDGDDLADVGARTGLSRERIVELHAAREYRVYVIGFVPGFAYLGELDEALVLPRRATPRKRVPAGSVAIAEAQTAIYPFSSPGGWHLIGRTEMTMFDPSAAQPALLRVGDTVIFEPIDG